MSGRREVRVEVCGYDAKPVCRGKELDEELMQFMWFGLVVDQNPRRRFVDMNASFLEPPQVVFSRFIFQLQHPGRSADLVGELFKEREGGRRRAGNSGSSKNHKFPVLLRAKECLRKIYAFNYHLLLGGHHAAGGGMGMRGGAVFHIRSISAGVRA